MKDQKMETPGAGQHTGGKGQDRSVNHTINGDSIAPNVPGADPEGLLPNRDKVLEALRFLHRGEAVMLNAKTAQGMSGRLHADLAEAADWAVERNGAGGLNVYVSAARIRDGFSGRKAGDADVVGSRWLWADLDPDKKDPRPIEVKRAELLDRLTVKRPAGVPAPTAVIDSGGGFWGLWLLDEELPPDAIRARLHWLAKKLGGDHTTDPSRIMRLPGTVNWPDDAKRAAGQVPALAAFKSRSGAAHPASAFGTVEEGDMPPWDAEMPDVDWDRLPRFDSPADIPGVSDNIRALIARGEDPDEPGKHPSRSEVLFAALCAMVRAGLSDDVIAGVATDPSFEVCAHLYDPKGRQLSPDQRRLTAKVKKDVLRQIANARAKVGAGDAGLVRPDVLVDYNRLHEMLDNAEAALLASGLPLYQSAGGVVTPVRHNGGALRLRAVEATAMREYMTRAANFYEPRKGPDGEPRKKPAAPNAGFTQAYVARAGLGTCRLPVCRGLVGHPTIRADGSLLWDEGWDPATGLIVDHGGVSFPAVPDAPTREQAAQALETLKEVIKGFPFVDAPSRSVALAAMLTAVCRRSLDFAPVHAFNAPSPETGKSLLSDIPSMMATGEPAAKHTQDRNPEEDKKTLLGVLQQGDPVLVMDNVERAVEGSTWCLILTSPEWEARWLGANEQRRVLTNVLFIFNGNNIEFRGDMATRAVMATIDAGVEEPAARTFDVDLRKDVPRRRGELVSAALTVLRGHAAAGMPGARSDTRFLGWSRLVRGALLWLGEADPWETRHAVRGGDSARDEAVRLMDALEANFGREPFSARDVCREGGRWSDEATDIQAALGAALEERQPSVMDARGAPSSLKVGKALVKMCGRIVRGRTIAAVGRDRLRGNLFMVTNGGPEAGR